MPLVNVAIVAVDGFSPFHYSVPLHSVWRYGIRGKAL